MILMYTISRRDLRQGPDGKYNKEKKGGGKVFAISLRDLRQGPDGDDAADPSQEARQGVERYSANLHV
jgi:hypothetical protein